MSDIKQHFNASKHMINVARELLYSKGISAIPDPNTAVCHFNHDI